MITKHIHSIQRGAPHQSPLRHPLLKATLRLNCKTPRHKDLSFVLLCHAPKEQEITLRGSRNTFLISVKFVGLTLVCSLRLGDSFPIPISRSPDLISLLCSKLCLLILIFDCLCQFGTQIFGPIPA